MEFDEYEYLEKTVENQDDSRENSSKSKRSKDGASEKSEKSHRKRDVDDGVGGDERRSKKSRAGDEENGSRRDRDREEKDRSSRRDKDRHRSSRDSGLERDREDKDRDRERSSRDKDKERDRDRERERDKEKEKKERDREKDMGERDREDRERDRDRDKDKERSQRSSSRSHRSRSPRRSSSRSRRSSSRSHRPEIDFERDRLDIRESRRFKDKKEGVEPEADPERDQRTVFAYQMPLKATERDVYEFFSKAGKVRDVRLIMDRNSRRSKGVGYIEFYDAMSVPMAIALSGQLLLGQPVMVKPSEAEKNLVQSTTTTAAGAAGVYGATDRKLYVGNLHFNMTESHLKSIFEAFGPVELVQLPLDPETGHCKGFGFVQFAQLEHAKAAQSVNGKLEIAGRFLKISSVTDHVGTQDTVTKSADLDDDEGGLALNAQSRALLMQKLDRTGIATSIAGSLGVPGLNGAPIQSGMLPAAKPATVSMPTLPAQVITAASEAVGNPTECLLLKNLFDPATETEPDFDLDIKEDVEEECSKFGKVIHAYVDKNSAGHVYLRFENVAAAMNAQRAMHLRWFASRSISAIYMQPHEYEAKFKGTA